MPIGRIPTHKWNTNNIILMEWPLTIVFICINHALSMVFTWSTNWEKYDPAIIKCFNTKWSRKVNPLINTLTNSCSVGYNIGVCLTHSSNPISYTDIDREPYLTLTSPTLVWELLDIPKIIFRYEVSTKILRIYNARF